MGIFNRVVRDTATDINAEKMNCAEDRCIRWTTFQNLDLWFDSWEKFVVKYGFATINPDGLLYFSDEMKARIINMDKTCLSLDGEQQQSRRTSDCDVLRCTLPAAPESNVEVGSFDDDDNRELSGRRGDSTPLPIPDVGNVC
jgi:hypothetical protein